MSVKSKIMANSLLLLTLLLFISVYSYSTMRSIGNELETIAEDDIPLTAGITAVMVHQFEQASSLTRALLFAHMDNRQKEVNQQINKFNVLSEKVGENIKHAKLISEKGINFGHNQEEKKEFEHVEEQLIVIEKHHVDFEKHCHEIFRLLKANKLHEVDDALIPLEKEQDRLVQELESLIEEIGKFTEKAALDAEQHEHQAERVLIIIAVVATVLALATSIILSNRIVTDIKSATLIASGNLGDEIKFDSEDEIGELLLAMNGMRQKLLHMINEISGTTEQLSAAAEEISVIATETSTNIQDQQAETEQIATAMNQMNATVVEVSENVTRTATAAKDANAETGKGNSVVQDAVRGIQDLASKVENAAGVISDVEQNSENINTVLDVIKGIADQTNLLALNAAIEAARAGEQGRGFAVVADEVRTLAGRTQESTAEINSIIEKLQLGSRNAAQAMDDSQRQSHVVVQKAELVSNSLSAIADAVSQIDQMSEQIATSAEEQVAVSEEMNRNISHINNMASTNANGAKQTSEASQSLAKMASKLQVIVGQFKT